MVKGSYQVGLHLAAEAWTLLYMMGMGEPRASSLPMPVRLSPGIPGSPHGLTCNPLFVEALMGWPIGWTDIGSPAMGLSRWRQRMRSELWRLPD